MTFDSQMKKVYHNLAEKIGQYKNKEEFIAYADDSLEGKMFINAHRAAGNHGFANRSILTHHLDQAIEKVLKKNPGFDLLYDMPHVFVDQEEHYGQKAWVHRNNASRAFGPERMKNHPLFSQTGEPAFIPSSMSTPAYLAVGTDENESTFFSSAHGTGRRKNPETNIPKNKADLFEKMSHRQVKLYNAKSKGVVLQDAGYYKDVEEVIAGMVDNKIVKVVAKMEPVAVLMY
jgi:tRNA-splicing ligase RtcB